MAAAFAAAWLLGLLAAAPALRTGERYELPDRLRDALLLGVGIPFALALLGLLYPATCWLALALCLVVAYRKHAVMPRRCAAAAGPLPYLTIATLAIVAWPALMRPLLDGDSISYHLPSAAAWSHAHSVWTTDARYWWYPPASELFASGLFTVAGPFALPWCGVGAIALLGFRIVAWARVEFGASAWLADALAAATITAAPIALQAASLQNDVWLAAFFIESLWTARNDSVAAPRTLAMTALLKPVGWIFALIAACVTRAPRVAWSAAAVAPAVWLLHDVVLWRHAIAPPGATFGNGGAQSTILAHGIPALALVSVVAWRASPFALVALVAAAIGPIFTVQRLRPMSWAALAALLLFLVLPRAYADAHPQLSTGASLRYAVPAIALGGLLLVRPAKRAALAATIALIVSTLFGIVALLALFWNDAPTRSALGVAVVATALAALAAQRSWRWLPAAGVAAAIIAASLLSARQPVAYYQDALRVRGASTGVYAWIARTSPPVVGGWGLRVGTVNVLDPHARTLDLPDDGTCAAARAHGALMVVTAENERSAEFNAHRLGIARVCGPVRFDDGLSVAAGL